MSASAPSARAAARPSQRAAASTHRSGRAESHDGGGRSRPTAAESGTIRHLVVLDTALPLGPVMYRFRALADAAVKAGRRPTFDAVVPAVALGAGDRRFVENQLGADDADAAAEVVAARWRRDQLVEEFSSIGLQVGVANVGPGSTVRATTEAIERRERTDSIIVLTEPLGMSRWFRLDPPNRLARRTDIAITTIEVDPTVV